MDEYAPAVEELNDALSSIKAAIILLDHAGDQLDSIRDKLVLEHATFILELAFEAERALGYYKSNVGSLLLYQTATEVPKPPIHLTKFSLLFK